MGTSGIRKSRLAHDLIRSFPPIFGRSINALRMMKNKGKNEPKARPVSFALFILILILSNIASLQNNFSSDFISSILTALSILAGFLMSVILFTGNVDAISRLHLNEASEVIERTDHLLRSQIKAALSSLVTILFCVLWFCSMNFIWRKANETLLITGTVYTLLRSISLPFQLYELHNFKFDEILRQKKTESQQVWLEKKKEIFSKSMSDNSGDQIEDK